MASVLFVCRDARNSSVYVSPCRLSQRGRSGHEGVPEGGPDKVRIRTHRRPLFVGTAHNDLSCSVARRIVSSSSV